MLKQNLRYGIGGGAFLAAVYSAIAIPLELARLVSQPGHKSPLPLALITYWVGAPLGGLIVGALLPVARYWWGSMLVGWLAALPIAFLVSAAIAGFAIGSLEVAVALVMSILGPVTGLILWLQIRRERKAPQDHK